MNVWLVTTGSSDVQVTSNEDWNDWWQEIKKSLYRLRFEPTKAIDDDGEPYRLPARVLGIIHDRVPERVQPYLTFPLLQNFTRELKDKEVQIDQIIVLASDQTDIFPELEREAKRCPYWQDTSQLYPILENYFHVQFPMAVVKPLVLKPTSSGKGLDDWDAVLELVQQAIGNLEFETRPQAVYVSHQAGTPAISSAVQFSSLAKFGDRVRFLVSSEQSTRSSEVLPSSSYLKGIRKQEATALLGRPDYPGVQAIVEPYLKDDDTKVLLNAAIQWNSAKFDEFVNELQKLSDQKLAKEVKERSQHWWWIAYEEVYLAINRRDQGNIVEAFFHSFRAFEGAFAAWGQKEFIGHIEILKGIPSLRSSVLKSPKDYFSKSKCKKSSDLEKLRIKLEAEDSIELNLANLCKIFRSCRSEYKQECEDLKIFWDSDKEKNVSEKRNFIVHQVQGMSESDLQSFWGVESQEELEARLQKFLNFIVKEDFPEGFEFLETSSLMAKVHEELVSAIASL
ncbi:MAG TPA: hypothetical protein V6D10_22665 [Trichocoleus sp.]|jgi:hypothetical protein